MAETNKHNKTTKPSVLRTEGFSRSGKMIFRATNDNRAPLNYLIAKYAVWLGPLAVIFAGLIVWLV